MPLQFVTWFSDVVRDVAVRPLPTVELDAAPWIRRKKRRAKDDRSATVTLPTWDASQLDAGRVFVVLLPSAQLAPGGAIAAMRHRDATATRTMSAHLVGGVLAFAVMLVAPAALADKRAAHLVYSHGDAMSCPDEREIREAVAAALGYDPFQPDAALLVTATIARERGVLVGRVVIEDRKAATRGSREVSDPPPLPWTVALC